MESRASGRSLTARDCTNGRRENKKLKLGKSRPKEEVSKEATRDVILYFDTKAA